MYGCIGTFTTTTTLNVFFGLHPPPHSVEQRPFDRFFIDKFILSTLDTFWHLHRTQSERHTTKQTPHFMGLTKKKWSFLVHLFVVFCPYYLMHIIHTRFRCLLILIYLYLLIDRFGIRLILCFFYTVKMCLWSTYTQDIVSQICRKTIQTKTHGEQKIAFRLITINASS